jgi:hypothetical protein
MANRRVQEVAVILLTAGLLPYNPVGETKGFFYGLLYDVFLVTRLYSVDDRVTSE